MFVVGLLLVGWMLRRPDLRDSTAHVFGLLFDAAVPDEVESVERGGGATEMFSRERVS